MTEPIEREIRELEASNNELRELNEALISGIVALAAIKTKQQKEIEKLKSRARTHQ